MQRWMQSKDLKRRSDARSAVFGPFNRFKDKPSTFNARRPADPGHYVTGQGSLGTRAPRSFGPFESAVKAREFGAKVFEAGTLRVWAV